MAVFDPKADSLEEYLKIYNGRSAFPLFEGYEPYRMIWDKGLFIPDFSIIRVMWNVGRGDEHYLVSGEFELIGIEDEYHGAKPGKHDPRKILTKKSPAWEAQHLKI
jgi:hypothetical protein